MSEDGPSPSPRDSREISPLTVEVMHHCSAWDESSVSDESVAHAAQAAFAKARPQTAQSCEVAIVLSNDAEMRDLNRTWRKMDKPTNVLSFPASEAPNEFATLGDVVIAYETVQAEAAKARIPLSDHVSHLVVHGVLHLLGFDHLEDRQAEEMEALERKALASLGIADPFAREARLAETFQ